MRLILGVEFGVGLLATAVFVAGYLRVRGWWGSPEGRHMMAFTAVLGVMFGLLLLGRIVGGLPPLVWVVVGAVLDALLIHRVWLLIRAKRSSS